MSAPDPSHVVRAAGAAGRPARGWRAALGAAARRLALARRVLRTIVGAPDYERYVAHCRARAPEAPVLDAAAFERDRLAARYDRPGSRCC